MTHPKNTAQFEGTDRFEVLSLLGRGGMGVVYAVWDRERQTKVALKTINEGSATELLRLKTEFRALQELEHPNLISLGELFEEQGRWFFTMELVEGEDFISHVRRGKVAPVDPATGEAAIDESGGEGALAVSWDFDETRLRESLVQLGRALQVLHSTRRVHRDIKPANVLVQEDGRVVLLDFGLVTQSDPGQNSEGQYYPVGTARYMSPEQAASLQVGPEADWYSVGVLLYEALTGRTPFSGSYSQVLLAKHDQCPVAPACLNPAIPDDLNQLCIALLQHDPAQRPRAADVLQMLKPRKWMPLLMYPTSGTRMPVFVGRRRELELLLLAFDDVSTKGLVMFLVHGASGLGKSALLHAAGREILQKDPRTIILWGRCNERELVSYKAFDSVVDALSRNLVKLSEKEILQLMPRNVDFLARVFPVLSFLREVDGSALNTRGRTVTDLQEVRALAFQALREVLTRMSDRRPLVIFLDDIQWADEDSLKLLRSLIQPPDPPQLLLVFSMRTRTDEAKAATMVSSFEALFPSPPQNLRLGPLSMEAAGDLVEELLATNPELQDMDRGQAGFIAREAGGHPLYIHELMHHLQISGPEGLGELRLDDVLWARISTLDDEFRRLVELVSVSFGALRQDLAAQVLGCRPAEVFRTAARLRILHLVRTSGPGAEDIVEPYHDRVRDAVLARMDPISALAWHEAVVRVLRTTRNVEPERMAAHLECVGESEQAAKHLAEAADLAAAALAFDRAAGLYERALRLRTDAETSDPDLLRDLTVRLGNALANAGRGHDAAQALLKAITGARAAEALELKRKAAEQLLLSGYLDEGFEVTRQVLKSLGIRMPRTSFGALVSLLWRRFWVRLRGTGYKELDETEIPPVKLVNVDILFSIARGLALTDHIRGADFNTRFLLASLRLGEPRRILSALTMEANYAASSGPDSSHIRRTLASCEKLQLRLNDALAKIYMESARSYVSFMSGQWSVSFHSAETSFRLWSDYGGTSWERGMMDIQINWTLFYLGELAEMTRRMPALLQSAQDRGDLLSVSGLVLGLNNIMILNQHGAGEALREVDDMLSRWSVNGYHLQHYMALLARVHILLFQNEGVPAVDRIRDDWKRLNRSLLLFLPSVRNEIFHLRGRALLTRALQSPGSPGKDLRKQAAGDIRKLLRSRLPWVQAVGTLLDAAACAQLGDDETARVRLQSSVSQLDACEMKLYAAAARIRLGRLLGGDEGRMTLEQGWDFMTLQGVRDEAGMVSLLASGFPE